MALNLMTDDDRVVVKDSDLSAPNPDADVSYTLRPLTREIHKTILRACTSQRPNRRTHQMDEVVDWAKAGEDLLDYALVEWTGILIGGASAPCTRDNKLKLDTVRARDLLDKAGINQASDGGQAKADSFRIVAAVR